VEQWPLYESLRNTSAIIFGVMGAWLAIICPDGILDKLIYKGDYIGVTTGYNRSLFKQAQQLYTVSATPFYRLRQVGYRRNLSGLLPREDAL